MAFNIAQVQKLYVAYFNRPADTNGLAGWQSQLSATVPATQAQLTTLASGFSGSPEYAALYANQTNSQIINNLYLNLFGRSAETAGLNHWVGQLAAGTMTFAQIALQLTFSAQGTDATAINNKVTAATQFTNALDTPAKVAGYSGTAAAASARSFLASVTDNPTTLTTATANVAAAVASATAQGAGSPEGATIILTTGVDKGAAFVGTAKADTFNAPILTLNAGDEIDGGAGRDTLNATINGNVTATTRISNIEVLNFSAFGERTVDTINILGAQALNSVDSTGKMIFTNVSDKNITFGVSGAVNNAIDVTFQAGQLAGSNDVVKFLLNNATASAGADLRLITETAAETADLTVTGATNTLTNLTIAGTTLLIRGEGAELKIAAQPLNAKTSVIATEFKGDIIGSTIASGFSTLNVTGATGGSSLVLGNGNHNLMFTSGMTGAGSNVINLGNGNNRLDFTQVTTHGDAIILAGSGNDIVQISGAVALRASDLINLGGGNNTVQLVGTAATNALVMQNVQNLVVKNLAVGAHTVEVANNPLTVTVDAGTAATAMAAASILNLTAGSTVTVNNAASATGGLIKLNTTFAATQAASTLVLNAKMGITANATADMIKTEKITALTVTAADTLGDNVGDTILALNATSLTINAAKGVVAAVATTTTADKLKTLTVNGSDAVTLGDTTNVADLETVTIVGVKDVGVGTIAGSKLKNVNVSSSTGNAVVSTIGHTAATTDAVNVTVLGAKGATLGTGTVTDAAIHVTTARAVGNVSVTATDGALNSGVIKATTLGTLTYTATNGAISAGAIGTDDATGITVNLTAKTGNISNNGAGGAALVVTNSGGGIIATLAGDAAATVNYTIGAAGKGVVNLTATNKGGLATTILNEGTAGAGQTSTIVLGDAKATTTNALVLDGVVDNIVVTGGSGADKVSFVATNKFKTITLNLGLGSNTVDFTNLSGASTDESLAGKGVAINLSNDDFTFNPNTSNSTTIKASTAVAFDSAAAKKVVSGGLTVDLGGGSKGVVSSVVGTAVADHIIANNAGSEISAGFGEDTVVLGAGADTVIYGTKLGATAIALAANKIDVSNFTTTGGVLDKLSFGTGAAAATTVNTAVVATVATGANATTFIANLDTAIDGATGTTTGQQVVIIKAITGTASLLTAAVLEDGLTASDLTGAVYVIVVDDASTARVFFDAVAETDAGNGVILVGTITGSAMGSIGLDNIMFG